jgi:nicotinate dehydrogenase subunit A
MSIETELTVNGARRAVAAAPNTPLIFILRNDLGLTGTRHGCGQGSCGACTVLIEGRAVQSCNTPLSAVAGRRVTTIEGLRTAAGLHPLQQAFIDEQAGQCGYCLSGIIVAATALLQTSPVPSDGEIRAALDGHLCRCGAYERIVRAIRRAAGQMAPSPTSSNVTLGNPARGAT